MSYYRISQLTSDLYFIRWSRLAQGEDFHDEHEFIDDLTGLLESVPTPIYFLSDLRRARILNVAILQKLGGLTHHHNWAGSAAFADDALAEIFVGVFKKYAANSLQRKEIYPTADEAVAFLEMLNPGIDEGVDWNRVLSERSQDTAHHQEAVR